jgi:hypothetical protein
MREVIVLQLPHQIWSPTDIAYLDRLHICIVDGVVSQLSFDDHTLSGVSFTLELVGRTDTRYGVTSNKTMVLEGRITLYFVTKLDMCI